MQPLTRNNSDIQTTPRARLNSTEQTTKLIEAQKFS